jgi:hypothetical protein
MPRSHPRLAQSLKVLVGEGGEEVEDFGRLRQLKSIRLKNSLILTYCHSLTDSLPMMGPVVG